MKALLFRISQAFISIVLVLHQIDCHNFDAIDSSISIISGALFLIDVITNGSSYDTPYHRTEYGSISYILFGRKKKE